MNGSLLISLANESHDQAFRPIDRKQFHVKPHSAPGTIRKRVVGKKKHSGAGPCQRRIVASRHCIRYAVYLPAPACCAGGTRELRYGAGTYTVCWILGGGRPHGGWKNVAGLCLGQHAPPKIARIFRVAPFSPQSPGTSSQIRVKPQSNVPIPNWL